MDQILIIDEPLGDAGLLVALIPQLLKLLLPAVLLFRWHTTISLASQEHLDFGVVSEIEQLFVHVRFYAGHAHFGHVWYEDGRLSALITVSVFSPFV